MSTVIDHELVARFSAALERLNTGRGRIGLAVSGGSDSMAMLLLAHAAIPGGFEVATIDHGLRPEAKDECALVVEACDRRGVRCEVLRVEIGEGNVQALARQARYKALGAWAARRGLSSIATAHHADDQAETLLMRLNRASGLPGLAGVRPHGHIADGSMALIRPLLRFRSAELVSLCNDAGVAFARDASNEDEHFDRVRIRKALADADWLDSEAIAQSAMHLADAEEALRHYEQRLFEEHCHAACGSFAIRRPRSLPREMQRRLVARALEQFDGYARGGAVARMVERLSAGEGGNLGGVLASVEDGDWIFRREPARRSE